MSDEKKTKIIAPQQGMQTSLVRSSADIIFAGGGAGGGKTYAAILACAEPALDSSFRAIFLRKNLGDLKTTGGVVDLFKEIYGKYVDIRESAIPKIVFPSGAWIECRHVADENMKKISETYKGVQADLFVLEEVTAFEWKTFTYMMSRNRGRAKWGNKMICTLNPSKRHWTRKMLDWYIGNDGFPIPERDGVVRYFYVGGETVNDVIFGATKEDVYMKAKIDIDRKIRSLGREVSYKQLIKSMVFYQGKISQNKMMLANNEGYVGSIAASGAKQSQMLLEGNFNIDVDEEENIPIPPSVSREVFLADIQSNGDRWITCDLADYGTDNFVALAWDGFHIIDMITKSKTTCEENSNIILGFAAKHNVAPCHIIFDETGARYMHDYIPDAIGYYSQKKAMGIDKFSVSDLKTECYHRLARMLKNNKISMDEEVSKRRYVHLNLNTDVSVENEFIEECSVVRFKEIGSGIKRLMNKKEMNAKLGKGRSMDLLDPIAMRMYPILDIPHGEELVRTTFYKKESEDNIYSNQSIYDESMYC